MFTGSGNTETILFLQEQCLRLLYERKFSSKIEIKRICLTESVLGFLTELSSSQARNDMLKYIITILFLFVT